MEKEFKKKHLKFTYHWNKEYREKENVAQDDFIDRNNGYQMLSFFNRFLRLHGLFTLSSLHRLEKLFCKFMPREISIRSEIKTWLGKNWNKHFH